MRVFDRRRLLGGALAMALAVVGTPALAPATTDAAACVRISGDNFDAPGNDNYAANLNGEYVRIKNYCSTTKSVGGRKLHDAGPTLHRHPYAEVFVVESGQATFRIGDETVVVDGGHVVVSPPGEAHGSINTGTGELRLTAIHGAARFNTEWLAGPDPVWSSKPRE